MSGGDDSNVMTIEDAFAKTLADMEEAREQLDSVPVPEPIDTNPPSLVSAFEAGIPEVDAENPTPTVPLDTPISDSPPSEPPMGAPPAGPPMMGPPMGVPPAGPPMMGPPMGAPPAGPPMMGPPMGAPPAGPPMMGPPMGAPPAGPPMMGPPPGPPIDSPPGPPMMGPPPGPPIDSPPGPPSPPLSDDSDESSFQVADLSEITSDLESEEESNQEIEPSEVFDESIFEAGSAELSDSTGDLEVTETIMEPEFNPVDAEEFMSDFEGEWDESAPVRVSDIDRTEDMDW